MTSFAAMSMDVVRRLLRSKPAAGADTGRPALVLDGLSAVAAIEAAIGEVASLGASYPAAVGARAWSRRVREHPVNDLGARVGTVETDGPRAALAAAVGLAMSGQRTAAFLAGPDLLVAQDLLAHAAGQHLPLVVHVALRAPAAHAHALGSGHEAWHAASDCGWVQLFATSVQDAADLTLVARRVTERTLVPVMVACDGEQTALSAQDVRLPDPDLVRDYLGDPADPFDTPTVAQRLIHGAVRRRVPRAWDLERPALRTPLEGPEAWALGAAGRRTAFDAFVPAALDEAFATLAPRTGRAVATTFEHALEGARIVLVAQGAAVETAVAVADALRTSDGARVGVLGLRSLRPFPGPRVAHLLGRARAVAVLERADTPLAGDGPLLREVRAALDRARENAAHGSDAQPGYPALDRNGGPRLVSVPYGLGGLALRAADLRDLAKELASPRRPLVYLGLDFVRRASAYPKREALMDALRRDAPELADLGLRSDEPPPDVRPSGAVTFAVVRGPDDASRALAGEAATLIHERLGGHVRSRPALAWGDVAGPGADIVTWAASPLRDPGDDVPLDVAVLAGASDHLPAALASRVVADGVVLGRQGGTNEALLEALTALVVERTKSSPPASRVRAAREAMPVPDEVPGQTPPQVRDLDRADDTADCLSRFWDLTGVLYRAGDTAELTADPYRASGGVPLLSAAFAGAADEDPLLVFDPHAGAIDGRLWTTCPDGSVAPLVIAPRALIDAGVDLASRAGHPADALRGVAARLAKAVHAVVAASERPPATAGALLREAFDAVCAKGDLADDRRVALEDALARIIEIIGPLPVARTKAFYDDPERAAKGSGELFSLALNPDAGRSATLLRAAGRGGVLETVPRTPERVEAARRLWRLWNDLPDTRGATIEAARDHPDVGPLAAIMLSRHCLLAMAPTGAGEPASGLALAMRHVFGIAEYAVGPRLQQHLVDIESLRSALAERIRGLLSEALPTDDLDALGEGLDVLGRETVELTVLSEKVGGAVDGRQVDGAHLGRLVDAARGLADLAWRLGEGPDGLGRARVGLAMAPDATARALAVFPHNPFACPVVVAAGGETGAMARGLVEGHLRQHLAAMELMRRARAEIDGPATAEAIAAQPDLAWNDLSEGERGLCPPVLVVGDERSLGRGGLADLAWLLGSGLPIKIIVLGGIGGAADEGRSVDALGAFPASSRLDLALLALAGRSAVVVQTTLADGAHLAAGVKRAIAFDGPALVHVHAPSPGRHGFAAEQLREQARLAVASRAHPLFVFDPARGGVFGSCLDLEGNPAVADTLAPDDDGAASLTPVDWAANESRFAGHFRPLAPDDPVPTPIADYLELVRDDRIGRTPFALPRGDDAPARLRVDACLVADADERLRDWRILQELAGVVTPFTERVRAAAASDVAAAHEREMAEARAAHDARIAQLRDEFEREASVRVTDGLMQLAGYAPEPLAVAREADAR